MAFLYNSDYCFAPHLPQNFAVGFSGFPQLSQEEDVSVGSRDELKRRQVPTLVFIMVSMIVLIAILFTAVVFIPPAPAPVADKSPLRVFVLAGQSNMVGHGFISKKDGGKELNGTRSR